MRNKRFWLCFFLVSCNVSIVSGRNGNHRNLRRNLGRMIFIEKCRKKWKEHTFIINNMSIMQQNGTITFTTRKCHCNIRKRPAIKGNIWIYMSITFCYRPFFNDKWDLWCQNLFTMESFSIDYITLTQI